MPVVFNGSSLPVQRITRRAFDYLKTAHPGSFKQVPGTLLYDMFKAMSIAMCEELTNLNVSPGTLGLPGAIDFDTTTASTLDAVPFDPDF